MPRGYLFGPVNEKFAIENLSASRLSGVCRTLDFGAEGDYRIAPNDSWSELLKRIDDDWQPQFVAVFLHYRVIPDWFWDCPLPIVGMAGDWNLLWHHYRSCLPRCDLVLTDLAGIDAMQAEGMSHGRPMCLFGAGASFVSRRWPEQTRDIDILFVGNFHSQVQRERLPWLGRVAQLSERWNVCLTTECFGEEYANLLGRARIVFNRSIRGEANSRVFETIAGGALLFQEADNREVPVLLREGVDYVSYTSETLEAQLDRYLTDEPERARIAANAQSYLADVSFEASWMRVTDGLLHESKELRNRATERRSRHKPLSLFERSWQAVSNSIGDDPTLLSELRSVAASSRDATLLYWLGIAESNAPTPELPAVAHAFQRAWQIDPRHVLAGYALAFVLAKMGQTAFAIDQAKRTLGMVRRLTPADAVPLDVPPFPATYAHSLVEWERTAGCSGGDQTRERYAKIDLIRWLLLTLLSRLEADCGYAYEAQKLRPDLSDRVLGELLVKKGKVAEGIPWMQRACRHNPFDREMAGVLHQGFVFEGLFPEREEFVAQRRRLSKAAPRIVPEESWFSSSEQMPLTDAPQKRFAIVWQGTFDAVHSLAHVNRQIAGRLIERGHDLSLLRSPFPEPETNRVQLPPALAGRLGLALERADVHIRQHWPPNWTPPASGHWVLLQPWEFGAIPRDWLAPLKMVDEVWAPSRFVRDCFVQSGIPEERVFVIPFGVAIEWLDLPAVKFPLQTVKKFRFLFVGGTINRKGVDALLSAYARAFSSADDVCLVIKDMGVGTFYQNRTAENRIAQFRAQPNAPEIEYMSHALNDAEMASLYDSCDCLVHPYRGEGFGLPIVEAMGRGLPVIATGFGPTLDFCDSATAYLLPSRISFFADNSIDKMPTAGRPYLVDPDPDALRYWLKFVVENPAHAKKVGERARAKIRSGWTWNHTAAAIECRLSALSERPIARLNPAYAGASVVTTPGISLCMIVKNEERHLTECLQSVVGLVDEIIIVDTGSTDRTKEIALAFGAEVHDFPWIDDFAAARNESLRYAKKDWIFWMDADDRLDANAREAFARLRSQLDDAMSGYVMKCHCVPDPETGSSTIVDHVRLFRNRPAIRWKYRIHEQILPGIRQQGGEVGWTDLVINHVGYLDPHLRAKKRQRDLRLLLIEDAENPNDPFTLFNLGQSRHEEGRLDEALQYFRRSLAQSEPQDSIVRKLHSLIVQVFRQANRPHEALGAAQAGKEHFPNDPELHFQEGLCRQDLRDWLGAERCYLQILEGSDEKFFSSCDPGIRSFKTRHNLAVVYREMGQLAAAETQWKLALVDSDGFIPSLNSLGELYLTQERWGDLAEIVDQMRKAERSKLAAEIFVGRSQLAQGDFANARTTFEGLAKAYPEALPPKVLLSHVFLKSGDVNAARGALHAILALDPNNANARANLALLSSKDVKS